MSPQDVTRREMAVETAEDFIIKHHNEGIAKEPLADLYARQFHGRARAEPEDYRFVDAVLTNREG